MLDTIVIYCDNQSEIILLENSIFHDMSKHIEINFHFIRDMVSRGVVWLQHNSTAEQVVEAPCHLEKVKLASSKKLTLQITI